jgi:hypothetical protein
MSVRGKLTRVGAIVSPRVGAMGAASVSGMQPSLDGIRKLAERLLEERHTYLKFYGD